MDGALPKNNRLATLALSALGVVYGDIGTSPLYALREALSSVPVNSQNVLGVLSLIFWALVLVISLKYLVFIVRVDNDGEGGAIALISLLRRNMYTRRGYATLFILGLIGAALLFSDGMITPAISVISAVEGLSLVSNKFTPYVLPLTCLILLLLFSFQARGTEKVGRLFGPIMIVWFSTISLLGLAQIVQYPLVLKAVNPWYAFKVIQHLEYHPLWILAGVFLAVTGGEALYADISHFGDRPIRVTWFSFVFPALVLAYFGQGANLILHPQAIENPFYLIAPHYLLYPLIALATISTIIASQAMISAVFTIAKQALNLQLLPRLRVIYTSADLKGQVYVPNVNLLTAIGTLALVLTFKNSANLAHAYGLAVNLEMLIVTILISVILFKQFGWGWLKILCFVLVFISIDVIFLAANSLKIFHSGWVPVAFALAASVVMLTWRRVLRLLRQVSSLQKVSLAEIAQKAYAEHIVKVPGVGVFVNEPYDESRTCLLRHLDFNKTVHEVTILLDVEVTDKPIVHIEDRVLIQKQLSGIYHVKLYYGFMQRIDIPNTLRVCQEMKILPFLSGQHEFVYFMEFVNAKYSKGLNPQVPAWQKKLFVTLLNNFTRNLSFYHLPLHRTMIVGGFFEI